MTRVDNPRSASVQEIREAARRAAVEISAADSVAEALDKAARMAGPDGLVVVTGSIYMVGEAMRTMGISI